MKNLVASAALAIALATLSSHVAFAAEYVLPSLVTGVPGKNGSYWESEVRVVRRSLNETVTVRRIWVAIPGGGFHDDPVSAPSWTLETGYLAPRMIILQAGHFLQGTGATHGAVGLEISGAAQVFVRVANTRGKSPLPDDTPGVYACCLPGTGQLIPAMTAGVNGPSSVTWVTTGSSPFRTNLAIVNPNDTPLVVTVVPWSLRARLSPIGPPGPVWLEWLDSFAVQTTPLNLPPWGWLQVNDVFSLWENKDTSTGAPAKLDFVAPGLIALLPSTEQPYFAYASVIYSPSNDSEFVAAIPGVPEGYIAAP